MPIPSSVSDPFGYFVYIAKSLSQGAFNHWVVADRQKRTHVRFQANADLSAAIGIPQFETCPLVDHPSVHHKQQDVATLDCLQVASEYSVLCLVHWHTVCHGPPCRRHGRN